MRIENLGPNLQSYAYRALQCTPYFQDYGKVKTHTEISLCTPDIDLSNLFIDCPYFSVNLFQDGTFQYGSIKGYRKTVKHLEASGFNSNMVQLRVIVFAIVLMNCVCFNSNMVQLRALSFACV